MWITVLVKVGICGRNMKDTGPYEALWFEETMTVKIKYR